jgi:hypothetical protein
LRSPISTALLALLVVAGAAPAAEPVMPAQVQAAVDALKADPELGGKTTERRLRFKPRDSVDRDEPRAREPLPNWLRGLGRWLAEGGRAFMWLLGATALALVLVMARRWLQVRGDGAPDQALARPSHVRDLDIRPESLPLDIGRAVRELWQRGEHRAALSLLYRGALSRLVHVHAVPIVASSTEGDCIALARRGLPREASDFVARLVRAWQFAVYGEHLPDAASVLALCDEFDARLPAQPALAATRIEA